MRLYNSTTAQTVAMEQIAYHVPLNVFLLETDMKINTRPLQSCHFVTFTARGCILIEISAKI